MYVRKGRVVLSFVCSHHRLRGSVLLLGRVLLLGDGCVLLGLHLAVLRLLTVVGVLRVGLLLLVLGLGRLVLRLVLGLNDDGGGAGTVTAVVVSHARGLARDVDEHEDGEALASLQTAVEEPVEGKHVVVVGVIDKQQNEAVKTDADDSDVGDQAGQLAEAALTALELVAPVDGVPKKSVRLELHGEPD